MQLGVTEQDRGLDAIASISAALARARSLEDAARPLVEHVRELLGVDLSGVVLVDPDATVATGVLAVHRGEDVPWWPELRLELREEPSAIASAVFDAAPVTIYDVPNSHQASRRLVELTGAKSGAWVPIVAEERVVGVVTAVSTTAHRAFTSQEIALLQTLAGEVALALERLRSADALAEALARERAGARIARRLSVRQSSESPRP